MVKRISVRDEWVTEFDMSQIEEFIRGEFNSAPSSADIKKMVQMFSLGGFGEQRL